MMFNQGMSTRRSWLLMAGVAVLAMVALVPAGATNKTVSKNEIKALIANAETKADHQKIAQYFDAEAAKYEAESKEHAELAPFYQRNVPGIATKYPGSQQTFQHCDSLSKSLQKAAEDARALAAEHRHMANEASK